MRKLAYCMVLASCCMFGFSGCAKDAGTTPDQQNAEKAVNEGTAEGMSDTKDAATEDKAAAETPAADASSDTKAAEEKK